MRLAGDGLRQQRLAGTGRADEQDALRDPRAEVSVFLRILQEIDDLLQILLFLLQAGHVLEGRLAALHERRPALAEVHHLRVRAASAVRADQHDDYEGQHADRQHDRDDRPHVRFRLHIGHRPFELCALALVLHERFLDFAGIAGKEIVIGLVVVDIEIDRSGRHVGVLFDGHGRHGIFLQLVDELAQIHLLGVPVSAQRNGIKHDRQHQKQQDHDPGASALHLRLVLAHKKLLNYSSSKIT